ncbi:hypothetical protein AMTR_s03589p00007510, partial [Amborella trichopoda]
SNTLLWISAPIPDAAHSIKRIDFSGKAKTYSEALREEFFSKGEADLCIVSALCEQGSEIAKSEVKPSISKGMG